jgi:hypothetical protein
MDQADINNRFKYHAPKPDQVDHYVSLRDKAKSLAEMINLYCPEGREKSLSITALEECVMWANSSIARS